MLKVLVLCALVAVISAQKYTTKYDNVDVDQILRSDRLLKNYVNCLLDKARCSPDAMEIKRNLKDALNSGCSKCSEKQRFITRKVVKHLIENKKDLWNQLEAKYDPQGTYRSKYEAEIKNQGIKL